MARCLYHCRYSYNSEIKIAVPQKELPNHNGRSTSSNSTKEVICQFCDKIGHAANICYKVVHRILFGHSALLHILFAFSHALLVQSSSPFCCQSPLPKVSLSWSSLNLKLLNLNGELWGETRQIKCTTTKVKYENISLSNANSALVKAICNSCSSGFVYYAHNIEGSNDTNIFGGFALRIIEISMHSNNIFYRCFQIILYNFLHLCQDHRWYFLSWKLFLLSVVLNNDHGFVIDTNNDLEWQQHFIFFNNGITIFSTNQPLSICKRVIILIVSLSLCWKYREIIINFYIRQNYTFGPPF